MHTMTNTLVPPRAATAGLFSFALIGAAQASYGPALPGFKETFALSDGAAEVILSVHSAGALLGVLSALPRAGHRVARWRAGGAVILLANWRANRRYCTYLVASTCGSVYYRHSLWCPYNRHQ